MMTVGGSWPRIHREYFLLEDVCMLAQRCLKFVAKCSSGTENTLSKSLDHKDLCYQLAKVAGEGLSTLPNSKVGGVSAIQVSSRSRSFPGSEKVTERCHKCP